MRLRVLRLTRSIRHLGAKDECGRLNCFDHVLRSSDGLDAKVSYLIENPVRLGLVREWNQLPLVVDKGLRESLSHWFGDRQNLLGFAQRTAEGGCPYIFALPALLRQQAEHGHSVGRSYEDFSVHDRGRDELVAVAEMVAAAGGLVAVVEFVQVLASKACRTAGLLFSIAHTIPLLVPLAEMLGVAPGYPKLLAVWAAALVDNFAFVIVNA